MDIVIKGNFIYSIDIHKIESKNNSFMYIKDGKIVSISEEVPKGDVEVYDYSDKIIIPGLTDLHIHAPQYGFRGVWMDMELIDWLNCHAFPEEAKYADLKYAKAAYKIFIDDLKISATTRASIFSTLHTSSTILLMNLIERSGLKTFVGKVNMDINSPDILKEKDSGYSYEETIRWIEKCGEYKNVKPIITPRFVPTCSEDLLRKLGEIVKKYKIPVQSHLSENKREIEWVKNLHPNIKNYASVYDEFDLFGKYSKSIMAHCVWCDEDEIEKMKDRNVYVAHCPSSNMNLASGIAPIKKYLQEGIKVGLGSDVAGGTDKSIFKCIVNSIQMSKLYWRLIDSNVKPITLTEAFHMATLGGGSFFGNVGTFKEGYEADLLILDESQIKSNIKNFSLLERLERFIYLCDDRDVMHKFVSGIKIF